MPSHGCRAIVQYTGYSAGRAGDGSHSCSDDQGLGSDPDTWPELGGLSLSKGAHLTADNLSSTGTGDADVAFDAIALVPESSAVTGSRRDH